MTRNNICIIWISLTPPKHTFIKTHANKCDSEFCRSKPNGKNGHLFFAIKISVPIELNILFRLIEYSKQLQLILNEGPFEKKSKFQKVFHTIVQIYPSNYYSSWLKWGTTLQNF